MTSVARQPTWKERENNKRREKVEGAKEKEKWTKYVEERELGLIWGVFTDVPLDLERESGILVRA